MARRLLTRRRALTITAAAAGSFALGSGGSAGPMYEWQGRALGAEGTILIDGIDPHLAGRLVGLALGEIERLERIFSLYRPDSEVSRLNISGRLDRPSHDMRVLLDRSLSYWSATDGAFNPAVQPLWQFLSRHFAADPSAGDPDADMLGETARLCDAGRISVAADCIRLAPGMALTFNGIAQGYITDAVADLMRAEGLEHVLVQLGELRALPGRAWRVAIGGSEHEAALVDGALATSEPAGTPLSADSRWHHLIDPRTGHSGSGLASASVAASRACLADALSTAVAVSGERAIPSVARAFPGTVILAQRSDGTTISAGGGETDFIRS
ncbi:MAG TPA: FAD:protein FMN transferase [Afifellaceae bacterium]|nr:FAD:protein FMN transferase [Afifellaceae bacterium]